MFDHLKEVFKAMPQGIASWGRFNSLKDALDGKSLQDVTFTTSYPGQEGTKKTLGSTSGNLLFVLGYVNPGFHLAPYHWRLVDPNFSEEEISQKTHPANLAYWKASGLPQEAEGDVEHGSPHKSFSYSTNRSYYAAAQQDAQVVRSGYGAYVVSPKDKLVFSSTTDAAYPWDLVDESYLTSTNNLSLAEEAPKNLPGMEKSLGLPKLSRTEFSDEVYPLLASKLPKPGSILPLAKSLYGVVTPSSIVFVSPSTRGPKPTTVEFFDEPKYMIDLRKGGDTHPSFLLGFAQTFLNWDIQEFTDLGDPNGH